MERLTSKEEPIMQLIWKMKKGFVKDIIAALPEPKPPYSTISSIVRILEEKGMVGHKEFGRTHMYFPLVSKAKYRSSIFRNLITDYYDGSYTRLMSHIIKEEKLTKEEIGELARFIRETADD